MTSTVLRRVGSATVALGGTLAAPAVGSRAAARRRRAGSRIVKVEPWPGSLVDRDVAAHHLAEAPADREAQARAAVLARRRGVGLGERLEEPAHLLRRHADAGVGDRERHPVAAVRPRLASDVERDRARRSVNLRGVARAG